MKILVSILLFSIMLVGCHKGQEEVIIIPKDYIGYIIIIYNQKNSKEPKYEDGKIIYEIPESGILKTQLPDNSGWTNFPEFYYEKVSPENKITFKIESKDIPIDSVVASGGVYGGVNKDLAGNEVVRYLRYYIGNKAQTDSAYKKAEKLDIIKLTEQF